MYSFRWDSAKYNIPQIIIIKSLSRGHPSATSYNFSLIFAFWLMSDEASGITESGTSDTAHPTWWMNIYLCMKEPRRDVELCLHQRKKPVCLSVSLSVSVFLCLSVYVCESFCVCVCVWIVSSKKNTTWNFRIWRRARCVVRPLYCKRHHRCGITTIFMRRACSLDSLYVSLTQS